jgi:hypothetical protein
MKHEWKKHEKQFYLPKNQPEIIKIPTFKFFTIKGTGDPNNAFFSKYIEVLYSLSYAVKMSNKKKLEPKGYFDYTVYPLEGIWDICEKAKKTPIETLNKNDLIFKLMIRQPDFVDELFANFIIKQTQEKKQNELLEMVKFEEITEGICMQIMHVGSYDSEVKSFELLEKFTEKEGYNRKEKSHREIYISDPRKTSQDKMKTILRFAIEPAK